MTDLLDLILNNTYFHLVAVIAIGGVALAGFLMYRSLMKAIKEVKQDGN